MARRSRPTSQVDRAPEWAGVVALGSNGEAALVDEDEADQVIDAARADSVPRDRVLIAGTGRESTRATIAASHGAPPARRRRRARAHAVVLQGADDARRASCVTTRRSRTRLRCPCSSTTFRP